jgi:hypothetical protein
MSLAQILGVREGGDRRTEFLEVSRDETNGIPGTAPLGAVRSQ